MSAFKSSKSWKLWHGVWHRTSRGRLRSRVYPGEDLHSTWFLTNWDKCLFFFVFFFGSVQNVYIVCIYSICIQFRDLSKIMTHRVICERLADPALSFKSWLLVVTIQGAHAQMYADIFVPWCVTYVHLISGPPRKKTNGGSGFLWSTGEHNSLKFCTNIFLALAMYLKSVEARVTTIKFSVFSFRHTRSQRVEWINEGE